ncbi:hypothetical protein A7J71_13120 [Achromobacter insolitus]|jgi:hypothetical protein|nr:hypothetical protein BUW96_04870 [Achromobacter insolitus]AVG39148.1 hypothetical protein MC81_07075 [Achromobacter insolitus]AXA69832.1 hypothetical protein CE205_03970 [Achromobacter insolitus]OAD15917.1 hypothetical protein A3839_06040 [Achromobacter insolitus]OAE69819.1 hypothetical protein A7J71_13120 [Achromobacter insolitus]
MALADARLRRMSPRFLTGAAMPQIQFELALQPIAMASAPPFGTAAHRPPPQNPDDASDSAQGDEVPDEDIEPADTTSEDNAAEGPADR